MFGSSFASSLPSSSSGAPSAAAGSSSANNNKAGGGGLFGSSNTTSTSKNEGGAPSLPFAAGLLPTSISSNMKPFAPPNNTDNKSGVFSFGGSSSSSPAAGTTSVSSTSATGNNANSSFGANMFGTGGSNNKKSTTASTGLPFGGFSAGGVGGGGGMSPLKQGTKSAGATNNQSNTKSAFSGAASKAAAHAATHGTASSSTKGGVNSSALVPTTSHSSASSTFTNNNNNNTALAMKNTSIDNSCMSPNGRSFHSYLYDTSTNQHVIVSEFAPFGGDASSSSSSSSTTETIVGTPRNNDDNISSMKITTVLPTLIAECVNIDPVIELICVDGSNTNDGKSKNRMQHKHHQGGEIGGGDNKVMSTLPTLCLYTQTCAFLLVIGYPQPDKDDTQQQQCNIQGSILHVYEPFEKQLLMSPRDSSIVRIRPAPNGNSMFAKSGSLAMLLREGGEDDAVGYVLILYHGLPDSKGRDRGASTTTSETGAVTTPLRFNYEDLVRGMKDTVDAENEAYNLSSLRDQPPQSSSSSGANKKVVDFCFNTGSNANGFSSTSILLLCNDGCVYGASPIIFDGAMLPRTVVVNAISQLNDEIEASTSYLQSMSSSTPAPTLEHEGVEARMRQCRAARRYLLDVFGIPEGMVASSSSGRPMQGSYYVSASVVHTRSYSSGDVGGRYSQALEWQPRLQGPLIMPPEQMIEGGLPYACIESFGSAAGAGIIDGFVVARECKSSSSSMHVEFGILPGEGAVILPRFEFESDADCQLIDEIVRGTGMYVEGASIMNDTTSSEVAESPPAKTLASPSSNNNGRDCSIVVDPLDDIMVHVVTRSRIATVTTNAIAVTANCFKSRVGGSITNKNEGMSSIRTKVWSGLEVSLSNAALVGACVSGDVHLGHILLARISNGSMEVVNITATQCLHEASEQMKAKSEQLEAIGSDDKALEVLKKVKPLNELLQPLIDKVCDGLSKMGKIVGGATLPKDAGPENLAVFLDTQHSCEVNVIMPMEEMSKILSARRDLLTEMYNHQAAELVRLTALLDEFKKKYESNLKRVIDLESKASVLAERSSAVLTATRELRPQITDAEAAYFKELQRYETSCNKWEGAVGQLEKDATTSCDAMSAGAIENGDVHCLVDLQDPQKLENCHKLLRGQGLTLKKMEKKVKESSNAVEQLSKILSGLDSAESARLRLVGGDKENQK